MTARRSGENETDRSSTMFAPRTGAMSPSQCRLYAAFEIAYTSVDFAAAVAFVVGSILFFDSELQTAGTWFFLIGSLLFAAKPTLRLVREISYIRLGKTDTVAERALG